MTNPHYLMKNARPAERIKLVIDRAVLRDIEKYATNLNLVGEVGGILLGYRRDTNLHVIKATFPGKKDESRKFSFLRRDTSHQIIASKEWVLSGFKIDWVGEWHTHPEAVPSPSMTDISTWRDQLRRRRLSMAYVIVGTTESWIGCFVNHAAMPTTMEIVEDSSETILYNCGT